VAQQPCKGLLSSGSITTLLSSQPSRVCIPLNSRPRKQRASNRKEVTSGSLARYG
jgi:hypothetical protein